MLIKLGNEYINPAAIKCAELLHTKDKSYYRVQFLDGSVRDFSDINDLEGQLSTIVPAQPGFMLLTVSDDGSVLESEVVAFAIDSADTEFMTPRPVAYDGMTVGRESAMGLRAPSGRVFSQDTFFESQEQFVASVLEANKAA